MANNPTLLHSLQKITYEGCLCLMQDKISDRISAPPKFFLGDWVKVDDDEEIYQVIGLSIARPFDNEGSLTYSYNLYCSDGIIRWEIFEKFLTSVDPA